MKHLLTRIGQFLVSLAGTDRFTDNHDGTVTDNSSGLVWMQSSYCSGDTMWEWDQASEYCHNRESARSPRWRLPTRAELGALDLPSFHQYTGGDPLERMVRQKAAPYHTSAAVPYFSLNCRALWTADKLLVDAFKGTSLSNNGRNGPLGVLLVRG